MNNTYIEENLYELCKDILEWRKTGILSQKSKIRVLAETYKNCGGVDSLRLAEHEISKVAMEFVIHNKQMKIQYRSNNSGGSWRLSTEDWRKLELAGWNVKWEKKEWLGAMATSATKDFADIDQAISEFEQITGQDAYDLGCSCCGKPHNFYLSDEG